MGLRRVRIEPQGFCQLSSSLLIFAQAAKKNPKIVMCLRIIGVDPQGLGKMKNGLGILVLVQERLAEVVMR